MCLRDAATPPPLQRRMPRERPCEPVLELDTDHSPWLSCPDELADVLLRIVGPPPAPAQRRMNIDPSGRTASPKTALLGVSRGLARAMAGTGVTVSAVMAGPIHTEEVEDFGAEMVGEEMPWDEAQAEFVRRHRPTSPWRPIEPHEIADLVAYLSSDLASATTGGAVRVDGGFVDDLVWIRSSFPPTVTIPFRNEWLRRLLRPPPAPTAAARATRRATSRSSTRPSR